MKNKEIYAHNMVYELLLRPGGLAPARSPVVLGKFKKEKMEEEPSSSRITALEWNTHIQKRPKMYVGSTDNRGVSGILIQIMRMGIIVLEAHTIQINLMKGNRGEIVINGTGNEVKGNIAVYEQGYDKREEQWYFLLGNQVLNALSTSFKFEYWNNDSLILSQQFVDGLIQDGELTSEKFRINKLVIQFSLNQDIWRDFKWHHDFLNQEIREYCYMNEGLKIDFKYHEKDTDCRVVYQFENGLNDRLEIERLKGLDKMILRTWFNETIENFGLEVAFGLRNSAVDESIIKSYVNDQFTHEPEFGLYYELPQSYIAKIERSFFIKLL